MKRILLYSLTILSFLPVSCSKQVSEDSGSISSFDDLDGRTVVVLGGSTQDILLSGKCPGCNLLRVENETDGMTMVETGKACAILSSSLNWSVAKPSFSNIVEAGEPVDPTPIGFGINKGNPGLRDEFNEFLKDYLATNDIETVLAEWSDPDGCRQMPDPSSISAENGTLHFVTSAFLVPYTFISRGEVCGAEPEILARFAMSKGMRWDFANVAFSGLITYIQSGKADIGCCILSITPERQQSVDFSIPWMEESSLILVNRRFAPGGSTSEGDAVKEPFLTSIKDSLYKSLVKEDRYKMILQGLWTTILISILAALFGTLLGMLLCFCSMNRNRFLSCATDVFIEFMRCMPQVVFLMIMFYIVFGKSDLDGLWVAVIAFSLCFGAYTSVIFKSSVRSIDKGQGEAALSMGFGKVRAFLNVVLPQAVQRALPVYKGEFIGLVKATSIVGYIAVFDLTKAGDIIRSRTFEAFFPLILVTVIYFIIIWVLTLALKYVESKTQPKRKKFFK